MFALGMTAVSCEQIAKSRTVSGHTERLGNRLADHNFPKVFSAAIRRIATRVSVLSSSKGFCKYATSGNQVV